MRFGYQKGDVCGRNGCTGIIKEREVSGCCSCHLSAPCSYCTTPRGYCPECGWDSADGELLALKGASAWSFFPRTYFSLQEQFDRLADGEFGYVVWATFGTGQVVRGKHGGLSREEIKRRLGCADVYSMAQFKEYSDSEFMLSYFTD